MRSLLQPTIQNSMPYQSYAMPREEGREAVRDRKNFEHAVWSVFAVITLVIFAVSQFFPLVIVLALGLAAILFWAPFLSRNVEGNLVSAAIYFAIFVTALYPPLLGFFMGLEGRPNVFSAKVLLGIRSAFYGAWILAALVLFSAKRGEGKGKVQCLLIGATLAMSSLVGMKTPETYVTYLLNTFIPLLATIAIIPRIASAEMLDQRMQRFGKRFAFALVMLGLAYSCIVFLNLDIFRPDLAMAHQVVEGRGLDNTMPPQWQSYIGNTFYPRLVGTFPNPILFGYFCAIVSVVLIKNRSWLLAGICLIATCLTLSKGAILLLATTLILSAVLRHGAILFFPAVISITAANLVLAFLFDGSNRVHFRGLVGGLDSVLHAPVFNMLFGFGIGSGGNLARSQLADGPVSAGWLASGSESGIGVIAYQLGFFGLLLLLYLFLEIYKSWKHAAGARHPEVVALSFAWLSNMCLQEDLINVTVISQILMGILLLAGASRPLEMVRAARRRTSKG